MQSCPVAFHLVSGAQEGETRAEKAINDSKAGVGFEGQKGPQG